MRFCAIFALGRLPGLLDPGGRRLAAAIPGHSSAAPALRTMMRAFLLAAAATVATALTPAQADLLLSLQGRLQELNVRHGLTTIFAPASADLLAVHLMQLEQLEALYSLLDDDGSGSLTVHEMIVSAALPAARAPPHPPLQRQGAPSAQPAAISYDGACRTSSTASTTTPS